MFLLSSEIERQESQKSILRAFARTQAKKNQEIRTLDLLWGKNVLVIEKNF